MDTGRNLLAIYEYIKPLLDVGILTFLLYKAYQLIIRTNSIQIMRSALIVAAAYLLIWVLRLNTLLWIFNTIGPAILIGFAIVFQPEIRKVLLKLGQAEWFSAHKKSEYTSECIDEVVTAAEALSAMRRGMLVVFTKKTKLDDLIDTGVQLKYKQEAFKGTLNLSSSLLLTIFQFNTPLHDGACVIQNNNLVAAGCFLPLSENFGINKTFGTRHRAALGTTEKFSDCVVLVVSEESGAMSLAYDSKLHYDLSREQLRGTLGRLLKVAGMVDSGEEGAGEAVS